MKQRLSVSHINLTMALSRVTAQASARTLQFLLILDFEATCWGKGPTSSWDT